MTTNEWLQKLAASYAKRWLDRDGGVYDALVATPIGRRLQAMPMKLRLGTEAATYAASIIMQETMADRGLLTTFLREVLEDVPSEMMKRIINGGAAHVDAVVIPAAQNLDLPELVALCAWLEMLPPALLRDTLSVLARLSCERIRTLLSVPEDQRVGVLGIWVGRPLGPRRIALLDRFTAALRASA